MTVLLMTVALSALGALGAVLYSLAVGPTTAAGLIAGAIAVVAVVVGLLPAMAALDRRGPAKRWDGTDRE